MERINSRLHQIFTKHCKPKIGGGYSSSKSLAFKCGHHFHRMDYFDETIIKQVYRNWLAFFPKKEDLVRMSAYDIIEPITGRGISSLYNFRFLSDKNQRILTTASVARGKTGWERT
jgi:hypothetical protein